MPADRTGHSIFLSYSSKDRDLARALVEAIERQYGAGSVWWDRALESWGDYEMQIRNAGDQARVVVVLWSASAAASTWVKSEAGRADRDHKLVNVRAPGTSSRDIPSPYDQHHLNELADTAGILRSIEAVWTGSPVRTAVPLHEIWFRQHGQRLIDPKQRTLPRNPRDIGPSELLQAPYEVVGYIDVSDVQTQFFNWCTQPGRPSAGRLIHGPGGLGKTRLMVSLAARLRALGWTAGFLDRPRDSSEPALKQRWQAIEQLIHHGDHGEHGGDGDHDGHGDARGLLIVIDYAEARQDEVRALARCLSERPERPDAAPHPVRLVLLARSAGEWWTTLHADTPDIQRVFRSDDPASAIELPAVSTGAPRRALFQASLEAFRPWLDAPSAASATNADKRSPSEAYLAQIENDAEFSRPLAIQMAALVWLTSSRSAADATSVEELLRRVLGLERDHWRKILGNLHDEERRDLERAVAQVALVGGTPTLESTERLLMADAFYQGRRTARVDVDGVRRQLAILYGGPNGGIAPLEPDLIAEHHVATLGDKELLDSCVQWTETELPDAREQRRRYALTLIQRAAQFEHGSHAQAQAIVLLEHLAERHAVALAAAIVAVMVNEPGVLLNVVDRSVDRLVPEALTSLDDKLPSRSVTLLDVSLKIPARLVGLARQNLARASGEHNASHAAVAELDLATRLNNVGVRLSNLGRYEEALAAGQESVEIHRRLAKTHPEAFLPDLATSLLNQGARLSILERHEEALIAGQEAVAIRRRLAQERPDEFLPTLARSLGNVGVQLANLGRNEEALAETREAVAIRRRLAAMRPDAFLPDLSNSLDNLGIHLSKVTQQEEALAACEEALAIRRRLVETRPDAFLPDLADSLHSLGIRLLNLRRHQDALASSQEAIAIRRRLAKAHPEAFLPELARSLSVLSDVLAALDRHVEAAREVHEALATLAPFVERQPAAFRRLARAIVNDLLKHSEAASETPDFALIERVEQALGDAKPSE